MPSKKLRTTENLILITFPVVLFAGCAGSDIKPVETEQTPSTVFRIQTPENNNPAPATELAELTVNEFRGSHEKLATRESNIDLLSETTISEPVEPDMSSVPQQPVNTIVSTIPEQKIFYFDTNVYTLSDDQRALLQAHADYLLSNPGAVLVISGHADERGSEDYNQSLSEKRAMESYKLLTGLGVPADQLLTKGFGELVPMNTENNWDENRRVELEYTDPMILSSM